VLQNAELGMIQSAEARCYERRLTRNPWKISLGTDSWHSVTIISTVQCNSNVIPPTFSWHVVCYNCLLLMATCQRDMSFFFCDKRLPPASSQSYKRAVSTHQNEHAFDRETENRLVWVTACDPRAKWRCQRSSVLLRSLSRWCLVNGVT